MLHLSHLTYTYPQQDTPALHDVTLHIQPGEFVLITGPSGSGKSTLLRCLNGLVPHFSGGRIRGEVTLTRHSGESLDMLSVGPRRLSRLVGFVSQNPEAQAVLDRVEPEIAFGLEQAALAPAVMRVRVEEVLDLLDLTALRTRPLNTLSGGERQRVAIAAALALRPSLLVLDEPTSQLDPQSAEDVLQALVRLNEDLGLTIVLAEHRLERVLRYADRLVYLENGRILADGPVNTAITAVPHVPPIVELGRALGWHPLPLTVKEGRRFAAQNTRPRSPGKPVTNLPPTTLPAPLVIQGLRAGYQDNPVLHGVDLTVQAGEAVALMGRNGSGKTTLLKCAVGLLSPQQGKVLINGRATDQRQVADIAREVAYLPQHSDDLLFAASVTAELHLTLRNHHLEQRNGVGQLLQELGLSQVADAYPRDLSVGQRQRVALGAVTITHPRLLLLDEPTRGLDYAAKLSLVALWRRWLAQGMGLLLVTHDVELAALIADRVVILSQGEVIGNGRATDILPHSPLFAPQIARLFPGSGWLTVQDALYRQE